ncbi:MAG TPA: ThuA domain-containing protein, partial [Acidimicrobiales bacterium]|nr:ThuA domain-containing protein [Acidimicrobiales bacterium]
RYRSNAGTYRSNEGKAIGSPGMSDSSIFVVTQVAPYRDGPAGVHGVLPQASTALAEIGAMAGLDPRPVSDVSELDPRDLAGPGVLALFTIGETPWSREQREAIVDGVRSGRMGVLGVHAATDSCHGWEEYGTLLGARFDGHPWTQDFKVEVTDTSHPATKHLEPTFTWHDEVYLFRDLRPDAEVLLRAASNDLDMEASGARTPQCGFPLAWCFEEGSGRSFYSALGHFPWAWETPPHLRYLAGGLDWILANR